MNLVLMKKKNKFQYVEQFMNIMKPRAAALGFLFGALEAAEGSVRLLVAFVRLVYITSVKMASRGFWRLCGALNAISMRIDYCVFFHVLY